MTKAHGKPGSLRETGSLPALGGFKSPFLALSLILILIFIAECGVMLLFEAFFPNMPYYTKAFVDAFLLSYIIFPVLYFYIYRPMRSNIEVISKSRLDIAESEERYFRIFENAMDAVMIFDGETKRFEDANNATLNLLGYTKEEILNHTVLDISAEKDKTLENVRNILSGQNGSFIIHRRLLKRKDGTIFEAEIKPSTFTLNGRLKLMGIVRDVSEKIRVENERLRLATAIEQAANAIVITDKAGIIQFVNTAFERITGYSRDEVIGQNPNILKSGRQGPGFYEDLWETILSGRTWSGNFLNKRKDGVLFEERAVISPVMDSNGGIVNFVAVKRDVTAENRLQRARDFFANAASHELRTPLSKLKLLDMLLDTAAVRFQDEEDIRKSKEIAGEVYRELEGIVAATSLLTDVALNSKGELLPVVLRTILRNSMERAVNEITREKRNIALISDFSSIPEYTKVNGDLQLLEKAFFEILSNAVKYTSDGGEISVTAEISPKNAVISIYDEGGGLPKDELESVFMPFFSAENILGHSSGKFKYKGGGIGLGLTIARLILESHGGGISVDNRNDKAGLLVSVTLPLAQ